MKIYKIQDEREYNCVLELGIIFELLNSVILTKHEKRKSGMHFWHFQILNKL